MSEDILEKIAAHTRIRVEEKKSRIPLEAVRSKALAMECDTGFPFEKSLREGDITFICECKKASPSKGLIAPDYPYLDIAKEYEAAGAGAISVLTEPEWFLGSDDHLAGIAANVSIPVLRKDFTVDEYMIYEAKVLGASAVLLICSILGEERLKEYIGICDSLGLSALVEAHDEAEIASAVRAGARIIGVNNRNLRDFSVDIGNSGRLRSLVPQNILFVAESGIKTSDDIDRLREASVNAVLIGETLMRAPDKKAMLDSLRGRLPRIKLCGMRRPEDIGYANSYRPDYIGMIMSCGFRRSIGSDTAKELKGLLAPGIKAVGVFVNDSIDNIAKAVEDGIIDMVQLHGSEDAAYIEELRGRIRGVPVIKAFRLEKPEDAEKLDQCPADFLLLDSGTGTGQTFDWSLAADLPAKVLQRTFLAGGLNAGNVREAVERVHPFAVDTSSGIETDGVKDEAKIREYIERIRG